MACDFLNKTLIKLHQFTSEVHTYNWSECYKGLDEYKTDEDLADVLLFKDYSKALLKLYAACSIVFMVIGIPGNFFTIIALSNYRKIRNATAVFIINLSVSDLLFACCVLPVTVLVFLSESWTVGKLMCRLYPIINYALTASSMYTILAITINRYVMVTHPTLYPKLYQPRNLLFMIISIWIGSFSMTVPMLFEVWGRFSLDPKLGSCTIIDDKNGNSSKTPIVVLGIVFPSVFIIACYTRIMCIVRKSTSKSSRPVMSNIKTGSTSKQVESAKLSSSGNTYKGDSCSHIETNPSGLFTISKKILESKFRKHRYISNVPTKRDKKLQSMILAIMISFFGCYLPILIAMAVHAENALSNTMECFRLLHFLSVCSNPVIYVVMSKEYRQAYKEVFGFLWIFKK